MGWLCACRGKKTSRAKAKKPVRFWSVNLFPSKAKEVLLPKRGFNPSLDVMFCV